MDSIGNGAIATGLAGLHRVLIDTSQELVPAAAHAPRHPAQGWHGPTARAFGLALELLAIKLSHTATRLQAATELTESALWETTHHG